MTIRDEELDARWARRGSWCQSVWSFIPVSPEFSEAFYECYSLIIRFPLAPIVERRLAYGRPAAAPPIAVPSSACFKTNARPASANLVDLMQVSSSRPGDHNWKIPDHNGPKCRGHVTLRPKTLCPGPMSISSIVRLRTLRGAKPPSLPTDRLASLPTCRAGRRCG